MKLNGGSRSWPQLVVLALILLALGGCADVLPTPGAAAGPSAAPASHEELARRYAPVIHQGTASDQDFITAADFDGDWISNNNWQNQPGGDLSAHVYYSVTETGSHWFLFYSLFHPRDYTDEPCEESDGCHENDMESIQMVVRKDGTAQGQLQAVETLAHSDIHLYRAEDTVGKNALKVESEVRLEEGHPEVWVETWGHGIYAKRIILVPHVVTYRVGDEAEVPGGLADEDVAYRLVPIYDTLWQHRDEIGPGLAFDQPFDYRGQTLAANFDGDDYGLDKANIPWGYNQATGDTLLRGDWFLDPAKALQYHASFGGEFSTGYVHNRYLDDLGLAASP
ncbi:MAG: hypothetical protein M8467_18330 [Anaerolineae bacterium]|nr:hypothetical protein [Anaerolineae bacterium]